MPPVQKLKLTPAEYLAIERQAEFRSEYFDGEMFPLGGGTEAMAGGSRRHSRIATNLAFVLQQKLAGRPCQVFNSDLRVKVAENGLYTYPDLSLLCGEPLVEDAHGDTLLNPQGIVEVLSPSTEAYDRGRKFRRYEALPSLTEYILVSQDEPLIMSYTRTDSGGWNLVFTHGIEGTLLVHSVGVEVPLSAVYEKVDFTSAAESSTTPAAP